MSILSPKNEKDVLQAVARSAQALSLEIMVVGAGARDLLLEASTIRAQVRRTFDVDIAVRVVNWDEYDRLFQKLQDDFACRPDPRFKGRLLFDGGPSLDLVPFGAIADKHGNISWPPEHDVEMGTAGFLAVLNAATDIQVGGCALKVASFPSIVLLKFLAWNDRTARTDDLRDIWFIFDNYTDLIPQERLYDDQGADTDIFDTEENFDWTQTGARIVGRDVVRETGETGYELLQWIEPEKSTFRERFITALTSVVICTDQQAIDTIRKFRKGMDEQIAGH